MKREVRTTCVVALGALLLLLAGACAGTSGHAAKAPSTAAPSGDVWTKEERDRLLASWEEPLRQIPYTATQEDRQRLARCMLREFTAAFPGGPAEVAGTDAARLTAIGEEAGAHCGREFVEEVASSSSWSPATAATYIFRCVNEEGEEQRAFCTCLATNAREYYRTPKAFFQGMADWESDAEMSEEDHATADSLADSCGEHVSWSDRIIDAMVEACVEEKGDMQRDLCTCVISQAPTYFSTPSVLRDIIQKEREDMSPPELQAVANYISACSRYSR